MKRLVVCCLIVIIATCHFGTGNSTGYASGTVNEIFNGKTDTEIFNGKVVNGRLYAPIRAVGENIKAQVSWDGATKTATFIKDKKVIKMTLGSKILKVNNEQLQMDVSLLLENGSIFLPIRFIGDAIGYKTTWNQYNRIAGLFSEQEQVKESITVYAQPLFYKDGFKLLGEAINKVNNVANVAQKRQYLKPYFTDEMINLIIIGNLRYTDMSKQRGAYSYPKETNMKITLSQGVPGKSGFLGQDVLLTKRNNQWVVSSIKEQFYEIKSPS
ncbi:copper amine oxidase N-terminal domain-containing protein [Lysinibacillus sp. NPDC097214]|uniref:copper amine oxidase N-terminal domain-containing protein n=1 Tax=Lysinibacillus sp. NPDC097214 TaxID=3390584 RepID=UPI003D04D8D2